jgi:hypothetical protein
MSDYFSDLAEESRRNIARQDRLADPYGFWNAQLAAMAGEGSPPDVTPGTPHAGFYRLRGRRGWVPVAIWQEDGEWRASVGARLVTSPDEIDEMIFARCCRQAVTEEVWRGVVEQGQAWPDAPPEAAIPANDFANLPGDPREALEVQIRAEVEELKRWLNGRTIATEEEATKAADWGERIKRLGDEAEAMRVEAKRPHDEAAKHVQTLFVPMVNLARGGTALSKEAVTAFLVAKRQRIAAEAAKAAVTGAELPPQKLAVGNTGRVSLRSRKRARINSPEEAVAHLLSTPTGREMVIGFLQPLADKAAVAGFAMPGCTIVTETKAA